MPIKSGYSAVLRSYDKPKANKARSPASKFALQEEVGINLNTEDVAVRVMKKQNALSRQRKDDVNKSFDSVSALSTIEG